MEIKDQVLGSVVRRALDSETLSSLQFFYASFYAQYVAALELHKDDTFWYEPRSVVNFAEYLKQEGEYELSVVIDFLTTVGEVEIVPVSSFDIASKECEEC